MKWLTVACLMLFPSLALAQSPLALEVRALHTWAEEDGTLCLGEQDNSNFSLEIEPSLPLGEYLSAFGRFSHLFRSEADPRGADAWSVGISYRFEDILSIGHEETAPVPSSRARTAKKKPCK